MVSTANGVCLAVTEKIETILPKDKLARGPWIKSFLDINFNYIDMQELLYVKEQKWHKDTETAILYFSQSFQQWPVKHPTSAF